MLLDATIVRAVLLPASMKLLGDWNWYLPRWLAWLPGGHPRLSRRTEEHERGPRVGLRTPAATTGGE